MSALSGAAAGQAILASNEKAYQKKVAKINLVKVLRKLPYLDLFTPKFETELWRITSQYPSHWEDSDWIEVLRYALHKRYGDPKHMYKDSLKLRQYAIPYWNPTGAAINIHPMGLHDEEGKELASVKPGGIIGIPASYTTGGKYSTLQGVAPQLRPVPDKITKDIILEDLTPASYVEWISYCQLGISDCCKSPWVWSDAKQALLCTKCYKTDKHAKT